MPSFKRHVSLEISSVFFTTAAPTSDIIAFVPTFFCGLSQYLNPLVVGTAYTILVLD